MYPQTISCRGELRPSRILFWLLEGRGEGGEGRCPKNDLVLCVILALEYEHSYMVITRGKKREKKSNIVLSRRKKRR